MMHSFVHEILRDYEEKRNRAKAFKEKRLQEVYEKVPTIKKIDEELQKTGISISKALIRGTEDPEKTIEDFKQKLEQLKQERAILLTENNIPLQYLDENYSCEECKDTGFVNSGQKCKCFRQQLIIKAYNMSNLSNVLKKENFQHFNLDLFSDKPSEGQSLSPKENMMDILNICEGFVFNFNENNEENLLFYGETGLGKTFLTNCIAKALLDRGNIVIYQTSFKLLEILEELRFKNNDDKEKYNLLFEADLLIIDDLGTEMTNTFTNSEIFNIINSRLLSNKKTIVSTNLSPKEMMDRYDDRIFSRLFSKFTVLHFFGKDLRWETK
ncbi:ATP-binding protein [Alkaliphilus sp. MSJ-5]|uniref:ATP-binding protein n=1 Tax=Alkaliphilus flagellatus TaxID=2841507 RepID=A0ABS6G2E2_9FIRM|nr:ATP-binding protein [Alkaliphilus flagellatus]MBU5676354.1 ATP-binding protein [Alkaliphilus flagellatus]